MVGLCGRHHQALRDVSSHDIYGASPHGTRAYVFVAADDWGACHGDARSCCALCSTPRGDTRGAHPHDDRPDRSGFHSRSNSSAAGCQLHRAVQAPGGITATPRSTASSPRFATLSAASSPAFGEPREAPTPSAMFPAAAKLRGPAFDLCAHARLSSGVRHTTCSPIFSFRARDALTRGPARARHGLVSAYSSARCCRRPSLQHAGSP